MRAAAHGHSMEEEARVILKAALSQPARSQEENLFDAIRKRIEPLGGVVLPEIAREPIREPPDFE
jgi:plasmid stability protein